MPLSWQLSGMPARLECSALCSALFIVFSPKGGELGHAARVRDAAGFRPIVRGERWQLEGNSNIAPQFAASVQSRLTGSRDFERTKSINLVISGFPRCRRRL
eukprot:3617238-Pyramimonas_sp.AAC.1